MWRSTVVYIAILAVEAFSAEGFHVDGHSVTRLYGSNFRTDLINDSHHFMTDRNSWHGTRHTAMLDVKVARADATQSDLDNGIRWLNKCWLWLFNQCELTFFYICVCLHVFTLL